MEKGERLSHISDDREVAILAERRVGGVKALNAPICMTKETVDVSYLYRFLVPNIC